MSSQVCTATPPSEGAVAQPTVRPKRRLKIRGFMESPVFQQCDEAARYLNLEHSSDYTVIVEKMFGFEFECLREKMKSENAEVEKMDVIVIDETDSTPKMVSGAAFIADTCHTTDFRLFDLPETDPNSYHQLAKKNLLSFLRGTGSTFCWMLVKIGDLIQGRIVFQLHSKRLPRTCANFLHLCRGDLPDATDSNGKPVKLHYKNSEFFRVVKGGWVQCGDITGQRGRGGWSIYGKTFPDESFEVPHDDVGIVGMANNGEHTNASSFYITTQKCGWMNGKYVAFGRVVEGLKVVQAIHNVDVKHNQAPIVSIVVEDCGSIDVE